MTVVADMLFGSNLLTFPRIGIDAARDAYWKRDSVLSRFSSPPCPKQWSLLPFVFDEQ